MFEIAVAARFYRAATDASEVERQVRGGRIKSKGPRGADISLCAVGSIILGKANYSDPFGSSKLAICLRKCSALTFYIVLPYAP